MFLELRHLRSVKAIEETGSLAQAAERLHLTQSALSHQIKSIESYFGISLYQRKHKPLKLSPAGCQLLQLAQQLLPLVDTAEYELKRMAGMEAGRLHITIECHSCFEWLIPTLNTYRRRWPDVEVDIRLANNFDPLPALLHGDIDLVISSDRIDEPELHYEPLFEFEALAILHRDHALAHNNCLQPRDFAQQTLITYPVAEQRLDVFKHFLDMQQVKPHAVRQSELTAMIVQLVASGRGIAVLPDWVIAEHANPADLVARPLGEQGLHGEVYAALRRREAQLGYQQDFIQLARDAMREKRSALENTLA